MQSGCVVACRRHLAPSTDCGQFMNEVTRVSQENGQSSEGFSEVHLQFRNSSPLACLIALNLIDGMVITGCEYDEISF